MSYDPRQAYYNRMTPSAKRGMARQSQSMFADTLGGDSSNYNDNRTAPTTVQNSPRKKDNR